MEESLSPPWKLRWYPTGDHPPLRGGQGSIRRVHDAAGKTGALKELLPEAVGNSERRQRMAREVLALEKAAGARIPRVLDHNVGDVANRLIPLYFVQEWIEGQSLDRAYEGKPVALDDALIFTRLLAETVGHCHACGVYHRDIKPENIIVTATQEPFLVDFGIAWVDPLFREVNEKHTALGTELGNRFLRLPELSAGQPKDDPRADVAFLVGILFYLLTGERPRGLVVDGAGRPPHEAWEDKFTEETRRDPRFGSRLKGLFRVGFQLAPDLRFQNTQYLITAIDEMLNPQPAPSSTLEQQLAAFDAVMKSTAVQQRQQVEAGMMSASRRLEHELRKRAEQIGLQPVGNAGGPILTDEGSAVIVPFQIYRKNYQYPTSRMQHRIDRDKEVPSLVIASYTNVHGNHVYYRGPAADVERLQEEVIRNADAIFGAMLAILTELLDGTPQ